MKSIVKLILLAVVLYGCKGEKIKDPTIQYKMYTTFWGGAMPQAICRYGYTAYTNGDTYEFQDSCICYKVGDKVFKKPTP